MKQSVLGFILIVTAYFAYGQCGPYTLTIQDIGCQQSQFIILGASAAQQIIWNYGFPDTINRGPIGLTIAGGILSGSAANQLTNPSGVFLDNAGNIYVADQVNNRIQKFPAGSTSPINGNIVAGGNGAGSSANQLSNPTYVYVDASNNIYVADLGNNRIQKFPSGSTTTTNGVTVAGGNGMGTAANQFTPSGVFLDISGNIFVSDSYNDRIQKFPASSTSTTYGTTVAGGNATGGLANQFNYPSGLYVDASDNIYVADAGNNRIQKFPSGSTSGTNATTVAGGNGAGAAANQLNSPTSVYLDTSGNIYVADEYNYRVQKFPTGSTSFTNGVTVAGGNKPGVSGNQFDNPTCVCVDASSNIYVADELNNRIQKWSQPSIIGIDTILSLPYMCGYGYAIVTDTSGCKIVLDTVHGLYAYFTLQPTSTPHLWDIVNQCTGNNLSYSWNWGDGSPNNIGTAPSHTYDTAGTYTIEVTIADSVGCTASYQDTSVYLFKNQASQMIYVNVQVPSGINEMNPVEPQINYYNGAVHFSQNMQMPANLKLYDLSGQIVMQQDNFTGNSWAINPGLASGVYIIQLQNSSYSISTKLMMFK